MTPFHLKIVTPDGLIYDGQAEELLVRTTNGDVGILARHMNYVAPLGMGRAVIVSDGQRRTAACIGGMVSVSKGEVTLVPTTFEWADKIDVARAEAAVKSGEGTPRQKRIRHRPASGRSQASPRTGQKERCLQLISDHPGIRMDTGVVSGCGPQRPRHTPPHLLKNGCGGRK